MDRSRLTLVHDAAATKPTAGVAPYLWFLAILVVVVASTLFGADEARSEVDPREQAERGLQAARVQGGVVVCVPATLEELRARLGANPLDWKTRLAYSGLLFGVATHVDQMTAPAFHARRAVQLAPVTVPAVRTATMILLRTGDADEARRLIREMFTYDSGAATRLLVRAEPFLGEGEVLGAIPDDPSSWLAWAIRLGREGREEDASRMVARTIERWPGHWPAVGWVARQAVSREDWPSLSSILPRDRAIPSTPETAPLLALRARSAIENGNQDAAREDLRSALETPRPDTQTLTYAGEAYAALGDHEQAARLWRRALYALPGGETATRRTLLLYLARLEDAHGRPATALRLWKQLQQLDPDHPQAQRRIDDLSGFRR